MHLETNNKKLGYKLGSSSIENDRELCMLVSHRKPGWCDMSVKQARKDISAKRERNNSAFIRIIGKSPCITVAVHVQGRRIQSQTEAQEVC